MNRMKEYTVITGASSGIGYEAALAFAGRGEHLILAARRRERLEELSNMIHREHPQLDIVVYAVDLSHIDAIYKFYRDLAGYRLKTWINNAGMGDYSLLHRQDPEKISQMIRLNVEAVTILSALFVSQYCDVEGTQLINISSAGGYMIVPNAITYCATKFYVSAFTEGVARELTGSGAKLRAKVLAPAATETEFGRVACGTDHYDYDQMFGTYHTAAQMARFLLSLYDSDSAVGAVNRETFDFHLSEPQFPYAGSGGGNDFDSDG